VVHLAGGSSVGSAITNPREDFFRTVVTTVELLEWLRVEAPEAKLLVVSSAAVYGAGHSGQIAEDDDARPFSPYGYHKRLMEEICCSYAASYGQSSVIARLFSVYGVGLRKQLLWDLCSRIASGADPVVLGGSGEELRDWTDVRDVVRALLALLECADTSVPVINVGTGLGTSVREIAGIVRACWIEQQHPPIALRFDGQTRVGDPFSLIARPHRLHSLGFKWQIELRDGLANYVEWFRRRGER
jgi:UDP-glucose 4-epimerase